MFTRSRAFLLLLAALVAVGLPTLGQSSKADSESEILLAIDRLLFLNTMHGSYAETLEITLSDPDGTSHRSVVELLLSIDGENYRALLRTLEPETSAGTSHLILEDESVYLCTPDLAMPMQVSGSTDLFGDSSITTTAGISYSVDFVLEDMTQEESDAGPLLRLELTAASEAFPYPQATLWVQPFTYVPTRCTLYSLSGDALVEIEYAEFGIQGEDNYLIHQRVRGLLGSETTTDLRVLDLSNKPIAPEVFDLDHFCVKE